MERAQTLANLWIVVQTIVWIVGLDGVADFFSDRYYHNLARRIFVLFVDRDPARPRAPDSWEEWYYS
jgi:hypothetical protein